MADFQMGIGVSIEFPESLSSLEAKLKSKLNELAKKTSLNISLDSKSLGEMQKQLDDLQKKLSNSMEKTQKEINQKTSKLRLFDRNKLEEDGRDYFVGTGNLVSKIKKQFSSLGDVNIDIFKNAKQQATGFSVEVKKLDGTIEKLKYNLAYIKNENGNGKQRGFVFDSSNVSDKNLGNVLQSNLNKLEQFQIKMAKLQDSFSSPKSGVKDINNINELNSRYTKLGELINNLKTNNSNLTQEQERGIKRQIANLELQIKKYKDLESVSKQSSASTSKTFTLGDINAQVQKWENALARLKVGKDKVFSNDKVAQDMNEFLGSIDKFKNGSASIKEVNGHFDNLRTKVAQVSGEMKNTTKDGYSFFQMIELGAKKIAVWGVATTLVYGTLRQLQEGIGFLTEQTKVFTNLQMEMTNANLVFEDVVGTANDYAIAMGTTTDSVMKAISVFSTYTSTMDEVLEKSKSAIILSNITGQSIEQTADDVMGVMSQFGLSSEKSMYVADVITGTARMLQIDYPKAVAGLSEGIRTVGAVAVESKASLEQLSAMVGVVTEKNRKSFEENANAMRTIFGRILNVGEDADPDAQKKLEKTLHSIGVSIREIGGDGQTLRPINDILKDMAGRWNTLSDAQKQNLAFESAG